MLNRRQTVIGYLTFLVARYAVRRQVRRRLGAMRLAGGGRLALLSDRRTDATREGTRMLKRTKKVGHSGLGGTKAAGRAGLEQGSAVVEAVRPIVTRALNDPKLHDALRHAFSTGKEVNSRLSGKKPAKAARKLADDRKLQKRAAASATELRDALGGLFEKPKKERKRRRGLLILGVIAAVAAAVPFIKKRLGGGDDDLGDSGGF